MIKNIGIVGQGFVGSAIREGLANFYEIRTFDIDKDKCNSTHEDVCKNSDIIILTSLYECNSMLAIETMSLGGVLLCTTNCNLTHAGRNGAVKVSDYKLQNLIDELPSGINTIVEEGFESIRTGIVLVHLTTLSFVIPRPLPPLRLLPLLILLPS